MIAFGKSGTVTPVSWSIGGGRVSGTIDGGGDGGVSQGGSRKGNTAVGIPEVRQGGAFGVQTSDRLKLKASG